MQPVRSLLRKEQKRELKKRDRGGSKFRLLLTFPHD